MKSVLLLILMSFAIPLSASNMFDRIWNGKNIQKTSAANSWKQSGILERTFDITKKQVECILLANGYTEVQNNEEKSNFRRSRVSVWQKGKKRLLVMLTEINVGKTLFSWGVINDAK